MGPVDEPTPEPSGGSQLREGARLVLRAALVAGALLLAYYVAVPGGKFFYQGF